VTLGEIYGNDGQHVPDVQWIRDSAANGYIVFMANPTMHSVDDERELIRSVGAKVFSIGNPNQTRDGRALIFGRHLLRVIRRANEPGPCLWRLNPKSAITRDIP
jgi:hypothetical protein